MNYDELRRLESQATPGPWAESWTQDAPDAETAIWSTAPGLSAEDRAIINASWYDGPIVELTKPNAAFIAAARNALPALLDEVARLRAALEIYADDGNWARTPARDDDARLWLVVGDGYDVARAALGGGE